MAAGIVVGASLSGCAQSVAPPSLAPRPAEQARTDDGDLVLPAAEEIAVDPALVDTLGRLVTRAQDAAQQFDGIAARNASLLTRGLAAPPGSEAWLARQPIVSALQFARQEAAVALQDIDALVLEKGLAAADDKNQRADFRAAQAAQAQAEAIVDRVDRKLMAIVAPNTSLG